MYARFLKFNTDPGNRSEVEAMADKAFTVAREQKGFISIHFVISDDESTYGSFSLWETKDDADTGGATIRSQVSEKLAQIANAPPSLNTYEVYKPGE